MNKKRRVLVIAQVANPEWASVPLIGWSIASALRKVADVHIVTQIINKDAFIQAGLEEGKDFTAIDSEAVARPLWRLANFLSMGKGKGWTTRQAISALSYIYFEHLIWKEFGDRIKQGEFDIVHRVTPLSPTVSSRIAAKCKKARVPFILGPLNGGVPWPKGFDSERHREKEWLSYVRGAYKLMPGNKAMLDAASAILVGSRHTMNEIPQKHQNKLIYMPENGIDPKRFYRISEPEDNDVLRACFVGRLVPYKGPDMLLEAAAPLLKSGKMTIDIVGDGPMMEHLKTMVAAQKIKHGVTFHGWLEHRQVQDVLCRSHLLSFPSIREFGGGVVLEAMALGVVPLIVDYAGPGELVDDGLGHKIPIGPRAQIVSDFRKKLSELADDPASLAETGANCRSWIAKHFTWDKKAGKIAELYEQVLSHTRP